jgi:cobalt/nickel transport system permease protein
MTALSDHVPDPRLVTAYATRGNGPLHRVNAWTKAGVLGALVLAVTVVDHLGALAVLYTGAVAAYGIAGLPYRRLVGWYTLPAVFVLSVAAPVALLEPGTPVGGSIATPFGAAAVTWEGVALFAALALRSATVVTFVLAAAMTTRYGDVAAVLGRLLPSPLDQITLVAYRFTFVLLETLEDLVKAARARGATLSEFWANKRLYARLFGATMLSAIERAERLAKSMDARGYTGDVSAYGDLGRPPAVEIAAVVAAYGAVGAYAVVASGVVS